MCRSEDYALVTLDTDFADVQSYPPDEYSGIIVLRLRQQDKTHVLGMALRVTQMLSSQPLVGRLWIVEEERIRIRE